MEFMQPISLVMEVGKEGGRMDGAFLYYFSPLQIRIAEAEASKRLEQARGSDFDHVPLPWQAAARVASAGPPVFQSQLVERLWGCHQRGNL